MFKKQLYATLLLSSALLSVSTLASADEALTPTDATAPVDTTTPVETPTETPVPAPTDPTTALSTEESSQPEVTPEAPKSDEKPPIDNGNTDTLPVTPVEDNTTPSNSNETDTSSEVNTSSDSTDTEGGSDQPSKANNKNPALPKDKKDDIVDNGDGTKTVKTDDGESVKLDTDKSKPTNNARVTAEQAKEAGASQVGTTSKVTGQVVSNVTNSQPLTLESGFTITDIQDGVATLVDGTRRNLTEIGATKNSDGTYSVKTVDGKSVTLPETGDELFISALVSLIGLGFVGGTSYFTFKKKA